MSKYLAPLGVFVSGFILALAAYLFLPTLGTQADQIAAETTSYAGKFWLWNVVVTGNFLKLAVFLIIIVGTLWATAKAFLKVR